MNEDSVLSYLTDFESMEVPNAIEEVNAKVLQNIIDETEHVAVLFYGKVFWSFYFLFFSVQLIVEVSSLFFLSIREQIIL